MLQHKVILVIMDGWGLGKVPAADAIRAANTPFVDSLYRQYPNTTLTTCGEEVGLPEGQMGNSEVGHLNLGAGRIVYQELQRINVAVRSGELARNPTLHELIAYAKTNGKPLHLMGLVSDGGVHSHTQHLMALTDICKENGLSEVYIHVFTDGRDTDPKGGYGYVTELEKHLQGSVGTIASVSGRYYAMDRDNRWERVQKAYDVLVHGRGGSANSALEAIAGAYHNNVTDEFILPTAILRDGTPVATIKEGDAVLCFNFRTDRCREITRALTQTEFPTYGMSPLKLYYATMTEYDATFREVHVLFHNDNLNNTLGEIIANEGLKQIRIAETEKYPHVTFFFSGGREQPFEGEQRIMVPSPKVATYDLQPEMSALPITDAIVAELGREEASFVCLNYANADMVGHTGVWDAVIKAVETVDSCVARVVTTALEHGYTVFLTADHGNADMMINADGSPNTAHTTNPVPFFIIDKEWRGSIRPGKLGDLAPTILYMMGLPIPGEMTGKILVQDA
ncbi:2,3-bisphosphoglycerate-independent phosphoglycerate mutase [Flaviaesturariibacter flavus]|uniref:2,3-bisphosphoglycerate-independent phosphoglycerate mutase n=1 Tax=Flaviaesturariibacter flavus TaxID=2502780 RepID=A0A4R1BBA1_9BACT|nr:2,3-bisphosphoglycerate-independent phosphoglycerate mutase [Flaviaesturariibacter flavus]TCJ14275.1 2,3-bisphosphoglycerate-independent phosphoglycerate mutase [Flaviaesturariibacter flavus]